MTIVRTARGLEETCAVAADFSKLLNPGDVIALHGDLGAGKTAFVQALGAALGITRPMTSPTFVISLEYQTERFKLVHMDLYRLSGPDDLLDIGYAEAIESGAVVCVEWPVRAGELIPDNAWHVTMALTGDPDVREISIVKKD